MTHARSMTEFKVQRMSFGSFPLDMLRYESAWPASVEDSYNIERIVSNHGVRDTVPDITLRTWNVGITPERWMSFGWRVIEQRRV